MYHEYTREEIKLALTKNNIDLNNKKEEIKKAIISINENRDTSIFNIFNKQTNIEIDMQISSMMRMLYEIDETITENLYCVSIVDTDDENNRFFPLGEDELFVVRDYVESDIASVT